MQLIWSTLPTETVKQLQLLLLQVRTKDKVSRPFKHSLQVSILLMTMATDHGHQCYSMSAGGGESNLRTQKIARRAVPLLNWLIPLGAIASVINVTISMCTGEWLKSYERIPMDTPSTQNKDEFRVKRTVSGLWSLCYANTTEELEVHCFTIDYFAKDRYTPEPHDSTMAIPYTVTKAGPLFIVASIFLGIAILCATLGLIWRSKRISTFIAGIIFIISGLIMLIGIVVYLSVLQSEIGTKLRARNALDSAPFKYYYGYGFILIVIGFMFTELTGTCAIFWYIYWHQLDWYKKEGYNNGDIGIAASRPLCKNGEPECGFTTTDPHYSAANNVGWNASGRHQHHNNTNHRNHHHHAHGEADSRGFSRGNELNSYYTYSAVGDGATYCKKHGHPNYQCRQQQFPCYCANNSSSKKYRHHKHHHHGAHNHVSGANSSNQFYHHYGDDYDEDVDNILEVPFPPPPPNRPIPRDITCTTTVSGSGDDFYGNPHDAHGIRDSRELRKTTPV